MSEQADSLDVEGTEYPTANEMVHTIHYLWWNDWDVRTSWRLLHPVLRRCWVQHWMSHLGPEVVRSMGDRDALLAGLTEDEPRHRWWAFFEASAVEYLAGLDPADGREWGVGAEPHLVAPDVELLAIWPVPDDPAAPVPEGSPHVPMLMRFEPHAGWRLLNFFSVDEPVPGWPPNL